MKASRKSTKLTVIVLCAGLIGIALRLALYRLGYDSNGLMDNYHPLHVACLLLSAATAVFIALTVRHMGDSNRYEDNFPPNPLGKYAAILTPLWFLAEAYATGTYADERLGKVWIVMCVLSIPCIVVTCFCQARGKQPFFLLHSVLCLFFAVNMVSCYRRWSGNPQLPDYIFQLLACAALTLTAYQRAAFDANMGSRRRFLLFSYLAAFFCMLSFVGTESYHLYWGGLLWTVAGISAPRGTSHTAQPEPREDT